MPSLNAKHERFDKENCQLMAYGILDFYLTMYFTPRCTEAHIEWETFPASLHLNGIGTMVFGSNYLAIEIVKTLLWLLLNSQ